jgi:UDP-GlcNAc:undecaprenyl-phosphate GlcNAc-1-phosphate transferase
VTIALSFVGIIAWQTGHDTLLIFVAILLSALLAFLALNFRLPWRKPAMVYLGDSGSTFLGFVLAWLLIESTQNSTSMIPPELALWFVAIPLMDTMTLLIRRPLRGKSPFHPGRDHLHHKLFDLGFSNRRVVLSLYLVGVIISLMGLALFEQHIQESLAFFMFIGLFTFYLLIVSFMDIKSKR